MLALPEGGGRKKKQQPEEDDSQRETAREPEEETARGREEPARQRRSKKKNLTSTLTSTLDPVWQRMAASQLASVKGPAKSQPLYDYDYDYDDYDCDCDYNFIDSSAIDLSTSTLNARQAPSRDPAAAASDAADWLGRAASGDIKEVIDQGSSSRANQPGRRRKMRKTQASITQACSVAMPWS
ncbi:hypothetical protein H109_07703 [Trichophyton interdigitale MR816]|uniref:Uncharacterized protein n=1 Tax=Trichophyton interdigitale (strain MR816) TaxID=1215338 RepID=A0A059IYK7_TRIIM|nr:hypothetical protein H109_07703 [Trichophyton interdigitale MR816]